MAIDSAPRMRPHMVITFTVWIFCDHFSFQPSTIAYALILITETRRTKTPSSPPSAKYPHKYSAHSTRSATLCTARMSDRST